ncbi:phage_rel_nuc, putative phage-type endonuclease [uncultured Caudovirales phage]|uniref:Phage_rel_nuc, putative phage-type endonuclease n=1 Tax=uncultured Caudovirales phage TaxID=2100421 RepID=A0A6J7WFR9_9CAUD|nr:phage_rel_nuc, putative phage-type endonuclease [uncultured Caudovirales phage]
MDIQEVQQRTDAWHQLRAGKVTASRVADIIAKTKSGPSASRENYLAQLVCERMTGKPAESYSNAAMVWGTETEPFARAAYEGAKDVLVEEVGFVVHPSIEGAGASPDGLVGLFGLVEIKCPNTATHIQTLLDQKVPEKYNTQMQWQMACTSRQWCDFVSFDPRMDEGLQLFIKRVEYDPIYVSQLEKEVIFFLMEVEEKINKLNKLKV